MTGDRSAETPPTATTPSEPRPTPPEPKHFPGSIITVLALLGTGAPLGLLAPGIARVAALLLLTALAWLGVLRDARTRGRAHIVLEAMATIIAIQAVVAGGRWLGLL